MAKHKRMLIHGVAVFHQAKDSFWKYNRKKPKGNKLVKSPNSVDKKLRFSVREPVGLRCIQMVRGKSAKQIQADQ